MLQSQMQEQEVRLDGFLFGDLQKSRKRIIARLFALQVIQQGKF